MAEPGRVLYTPVRRRRNTDDVAGLTVRRGRILRVRSMVAAVGEKGRAHLRSPQSTDLELAAGNFSEAEGPENRF